MDWFKAFLIVYAIVMLGVFWWGIPRMFNRWGIDAIKSKTPHSGKSE